MGGKLMFMQSSGGLTGAGTSRARTRSCRGPAGGVVGAVADERRSPGEGRIIGFDMGGTSTDVCHFAGRVRAGAATREIAGVRITAPMMKHPHRRGGGRVDPQLRRGADAGGAGERRGRSGAGLLRARRAAGGDGRQRGHRAAAGRSSFRRSSGRGATGRSTSRRRGRGSRSSPPRSGGAPEAVAEGFLRIAVENMANAIKKISVQRGYDVSGYCLTVFGGAGAQHACAIADTLGMEVCLVHPMASLLSAYGMGLADIRATRTQAMEVALDAEGRLAAAALLDALGSDAEMEVEAQGVAPAEVRAGAGAAPEGEGDGHGPAGRRSGRWRRCGRRSRRRTGRGSASIPARRALVIEAAQAEAVGRGGGPDRAGARRVVERAEADRGGAGGAGLARRRLGRGALRAARGAAARGPVSGPAVVVEPHTSILVEPGWQARITAHDHVRLERVEARAAAEAVGTKADPVMLEVFNNLYMSIAEQMGAVLENTAASVTIKERLDFSCAVFDAARRSHRQCAAHAGASRVDGGERQGDHRAEPGDGAGGRLRAERALQRRDAPAGHHRGAAGLGRGAAGGCSSSRRRGGTIPTSAG